jgi:hypothetical protein
MSHQSLEHLLQSAGNTVRMLSSTAKPAATKST